MVRVSRNGGLTSALGGRHTVCMKRTNLVLDERLLEQATRLAGQKTYSRTVGLALEDFVRRMQARQILSLRGSGAWHGDLPAMRDSVAPRRARKAGKRAA
jgi:Arc/MetJ family transcription regulator